MFLIVIVIYSCSLIALHLPNGCRYFNYTYFLHTVVNNFNIWWLIWISSIQNLSKMFCPSFHYVSVLGKNVAMLVFHNSWIVGIFSGHQFGDFIEFLDISSPGCFLGFTYTVFDTFSSASSCFPFDLSISVPVKIKQGFHLCVIFAVKIVWSDLLYLWYKNPCIRFYPFLFHTISQGFSYSRSKRVFNIIPLFVDVVFTILGF